MATIVDPLGTPSVIYNRSGTALFTINAAGTNVSTGAAIPYVCGHAVAVATWISVSDFVVVLPTGTEIGDCVEIFCTTTDSITVLAPTGESVPGGSLSVDKNKGCRCIKVSSTDWYVIS